MPASDDPIIERKLIAKKQYAFLNAVQNDDFNHVKEALINRTIPLNIDCTDSFGYTPLSISAKQHSIVMMKLLINHAADPGDALLVSVQNQFMEGIAFLIDECNCDINEAVLSKHFVFGMNPLMVACHLNNYELIRYLIDHGAEQLSQNWQDYPQGDGIQSTHFRLNLYKALASPCYIAITKEDPLFSAFDIGKICRNLSKQDDDFRIEYFKLYEQCKMFSIEYFNLIATDKELASIMKMGSPGPKGEARLGNKKFSRILFAITNDHKDFIGHRFIQQALEEAFCASFPWRGKSSVVHIAFSLIIILILPIYWIVSIILPPIDVIDRTINAPIVRFFSAIAGHLSISIAVIWQLTNLNSFALSPDKSGSANDLVSEFNLIVIKQSPFNIWELYVLFWIIGRLFEIVRAIFDMGPILCFKEIWNIIDCLTCFLFGIAFIFRLQDRTGTVNDVTGDPDPYPRQLFEVFFSLACLMLLTKNNYWLSVIKRFGILNIIVDSAVGTIAKFLLISVIYQISFMVAVNDLLWKPILQVSTQCERIDQLTSGLRIDSCPSYIFNNNAKLFSSTGGALWLSFWALIGDINYLMIGQFFHFGQATTFEVRTAEILWIIFSCILVLTFLNIMIGLMYKTIQLKGDEFETLYKFKRAQLLLYFIMSKGSLPPPFNVIPSVSGLLKLVKFTMNKRKGGKRHEELRRAEQEEQEKNDLKHITTMLDEVKARWRRTLLANEDRKSLTGYDLKSTELKIRHRLGYLNRTMTQTTEKLTKIT